MRFDLLPLLICPNTGKPGFTCYATELSRGKTKLKCVANESIQSTDEVTTGLVISDDQQFVFPIRFGVLSMLSDDDIDMQGFKEHLDAIVDQCPPDVAELANRCLARLRERSDSNDGEWNREEMEYYDEEVSTGEKRSAMVKDIAEKNLPHIFLPRQKYILGPLAPDIEGRTVIEIGCGNARTIARLLPPSEYNYRYIGSDISFWRLVVAKSASQQSEFVQASAFNLPFVSGCADVGISFGMLHHLPRPLDGLNELNRTLKPKSQLAIHEPVVTSKIITGRNERLESALMTYEHSEHDGEIELDTFERELQNLGYSIDRKKFFVSPFRTVFEAIAGRVCPISLESQAVYRTVYLIDAILIKLVCPISRFLAPRAAILFGSKNES